MKHFYIWWNDSTVEEKLFTLMLTPFGWAAALLFSEAFARIAGVIL